MASKRQIRKEVITCTLTHTHAHRHTHTPPHACTFTHMHTDVHTHTHTHMYTHTPEHTHLSAEGWIPGQAVRISILDTEAWEAGFKGAESRQDEVVWMYCSLSSVNLVGKCQWRKQGK